MARGTLLLLLSVLGSFPVFAQSPVTAMPGTQFLRDREGNALGMNSPGSTPIYDAAKHPINDPAGKQLTLAAFSAAQGDLSFKCTSAGTRTVLRLWGLVPHGFYTGTIIIVGGMGGPPAGMGAWLKKQVPVTCIVDC